MLDGNRRGSMIAYELVARVCPLTQVDVRELATQVYASLKAQGYAHIDPQEGFERSFVEQWNQSYTERITKEFSHEPAVQFS